MITARINANHAASTVHALASATWDLEPCKSDLMTCQFIVVLKLPLKPTKVISYAFHYFKSLPCHFSSYYWKRFLSQLLY